MARPKKGTTAADRWWAGFEENRETGCWQWTGSLGAYGYGYLRVDGRSVGAHRFGYELLVGPIPMGFELDHFCHSTDTSCAGGVSCPHRACVNPGHLEPVTGRVNWERGNAPSVENAAKTHCKYGHSLSGDNLIIRKSGNRQCKTCNREKVREWRERRVAEGAPRDEKGRVRSAAYASAVAS